MSDRVYCYHCRDYHLQAEVTLVHTSRGKRWRCLKSFSYGKSSLAQRDAFGKSVSELNRARNARQGWKSLPRPVLELIHGAPARFASPA